jgi:hypothetical protein
MARQPQHAHARAPDNRRRRGRGYDYRVLLTGLESSVPFKPSTWAMMLLGFAGLGFFAYALPPPGSDSSQS